MGLILNEEQQMLEQTAREFIRAQAPVGRLRTSRKNEDPHGFSPDLWQQMAEMGWVGAMIPESHGGSGLGFAEMCTLLQETGRNLMPEPWLSTAVLATQTLLLSKNQAACDAWLGHIAAGEVLMTLAHQDGHHANPGHITTRATLDGDSYVLSGEKRHVLDGHVADCLIIPARTAGEDGDASGITLFLVASDAKGVDRARQRRIDSRHGADVTLKDVRVSSDAVLGEVGGGAALLESVLDRGRIALAAEMLGGACQAFDDTLAYLKEREQFGVAIGSFQALQHRAARMFIEIELARSAVRAAATAVDDNSEDVPKLASLAKARLADVFVLVTNEGVQMFGGVGVTDEYDIGLYMKRARGSVPLFGDAAWNRDRWASLSGY